MIARPLHGAHVCLRCQLRLSEQRVPFNATSSTRARHPRGVRQAHDEAASQASKQSEKVSVRRSKIVTDGLSFRPLRTGQNRISHLPIGRLYGHGYQLREQRQQLPVDTLGAESEVIVLRPSGLPYNSLPEMEEIPADKVDIQALVDSERGLPSQQDINSNLEEIRPKIQVLSTEDFKSLENQISRGFTIPQLIKYMALLKAEDEGTIREDRNKMTKGAVWTLGWLPGVSESADVFDEHPLRGYISDAYTPKQKLVLSLMRQYWNLEVEEVVESLGEIELHLDGPKLELLIKGDIPPLRMVSDSFISTEDEKIEAFRKRGVIRITASKEKARVIVQGIQEEIKNFDRMEIDIETFVSLSNSKNPLYDQDGFGDADITELARYTGTEIKRIPGNRLELSYVNEGSNTKLSTPGDTARGLLLASFDSLHNNFKQFLCTDSQEPLTALKQDAIDRMAWRDRLHSWARWVSPLPKAPSPEEQMAKSVEVVPENKNPKKDIGVSEQLPYSTSQSQKELDENRLANTTSNSQGYVYWDKKYFTTTSITIGQILHRIDSDAAAVSEPTDGTMRFVPSTRNVSKVLGKANQTFLHQRSSTVIKFRASPWTTAGADAMAKFPDVEMRFAVNPETEHLELKDVFAVAEVNTTNVMIPNRGLDLSFQQRTTSRLRALHYKTLPQIDDFLAASQLRKNFGSLRTPPNITLPIAQHLCSLLPGDPLVDTSSKPVEVEYICMGVEQRNTLAVPFEDWRLLYTSIEGGRGRGNWAELSLRPRRPRRAGFGLKARGPNWQKYKKTQDYIDTAYRLVDLLEGGAPEIVRMASSVVRHLKGGPSNAREDWRRLDFKYFNRVITFTGRPDDDKLTTSKAGTEEGDELDEVDDE